MMESSKKEISRLLQFDLNNPSLTRRRRQGDGIAPGLMPGLLIVILWIFCTVVVLSVSWSVLKAVCDGLPDNRTATSTITTTTAAVASIAAAAPNASGIMTAGAAAASQDVLSVLPVFVYSTAQKKKLSCSVCLMDFKEGGEGAVSPQVLPLLPCGLHRHVADFSFRLPRLPRLRRPRSSRACRLIFPTLLACIQL
ncbi:unnamed protein product [Musa banksii]